MAATSTVELVKCKPKEPWMKPVKSSAESAPVLFASYCGKMSKLKHASKVFFRTACMWREEPLNEPINAIPKEP